MEFTFESGSGETVEETQLKLTKLNLRLNNFNFYSFLSLTK